LPDGADEEDRNVRYILMTIHGPEHVDAWENASAAEKRAEIDRVTAWFRRHGAAVEVRPAGSSEADAAATA
jgi:hypothetical protein